MSERRFPDRAAILAARDRVVEEIELPEWGGWFRVQGWDGHTRWRILQQWPSPGQRSSVNLWALVACLSLVDAQDKRLFSDEDVGELAKKNARALDKIFQVALRLNGLDARAGDTLGKDSAPTPNGASTSTSPATSAE
jgi:hypothetical protein